ncbi:hypothetical protein [Mycobacteroides abscessus]|uniref:hypothetical protein n=2 Tax=Mycobacteroides abscessus TaxID=36809 RepID=UPI0010475117|nr:hypothetical protein [Mycobacteroides abscessus]
MTIIIGTEGTSGGEMIENNDFWGWSDLDHKQLMSDLGIGGDAITAALEQGLELGKGSPGGLTEIWNIKTVDEEED